MVLTGPRNRFTVNSMFWLQLAPVFDGRWIALETKDHVYGAEAVMLIVDLSARIPSQYKLTSALIG